MNRLTNISNPKVWDQGQTVSFSFTLENGDVIDYRVPTDALEVILCAFEHMANMALQERVTGGDLPFGRPEPIPAFTTRCDRFRVEESEEKELRLYCDRQDRPPIEIPLGRADYLQFQQALREGPNPSGTLPQ